jgi:hypothetical protein
MLGPVVPSSGPYSGNREPLKAATRRTVPSTVYRLCERGAPYVRASNAIRIRLTDLDVFLNQGRR